MQEEKPKPFEEPEDELTSLWKDSHGNGAPFAHAPPTGYIPTNAFLAGPTGMLAHGNNPNNPFLMPTPAPPPAQPQAPTYGPGSASRSACVRVAICASVEAVICDAWFHSTGCHPSGAGLIPLQAGWHVSLLSLEL